MRYLQKKMGMIGGNNSNQQSNGKEEGNSHSRKQDHKDQMDKMSPVCKEFDLMNAFDGMGIQQEKGSQNCPVEGKKSHEVDLLDLL